MRRAAGAVALLLLLRFAPPLVATDPAPPGAVVAVGVENLYTRPDEASPVDDQVILGETVEVLDETAGFAKVRTASGETAWIPERALRRGVPAPKRCGRVTSPQAHLYRLPDVTESRPLLTAPWGAELAVEEEFTVERHVWLRVALPDGRTAFVSKDDAALSCERPALTPDWFEAGKRFLGAPYTWGGTSPAGFDCSGLVYRLLKERGVVVKRNASQQCFREPKLAPVAFEDLSPGDLLFFGTDEKIDHEGIWAGDGWVLQATAYGVPSTQLTRFEASDRLKARYRYARRLSLTPVKPGPRDTAALQAKLTALAAEGGARFGIVFKDLSSGATVKLLADVVMHAASTMKTPVLLEAMRRVDAKTLKLADELPVKNLFESAVDASPFSIDLDPSTEGPTMAKLGGRARLDFLLNEMIVRSSNLATNLVLSHLGAKSVQKRLVELGAPTVTVRRCVEDGKAFEKGLNNETDAAGMATVMEACVRGDALSSASRAKVWEILTGQTLNEQIPAGLHPQSGAVVGHKTGNISSVQHDAAIVRLPDGREYVLVILADSFGANDEGRKRVIATSRKMSRAVWEAMIAP